MKTILATLLTVLLLFPFQAIADIQTITHTIKQPFGGSQSPDDARAAAITKAKREALERAGTYIESTTVVKNSQVDSEEILALTAGVTKAEVVTQKNYTDGDAFGIEITVRVTFDTAVLDQSLKRLLTDKKQLKELKAVRAREKDLLARIAELEKEDKRTDKTKQQSAILKKEFKKAGKGLTVIEWYYKARSLYDGEKYTDPRKAAEYYTQAIKLAPDFAEMYYFRGNAYNDNKQYNLAILDYTEAIKLNPAEATFYAMRGISYDNSKQFDLAIKDYKHAILLNPNNAMTYLNRGYAYLIKKKDYNLAIADFTQVIKLNPADASAYYARGTCYNYIGRNELAIADFTKSIELSPGNPDNYGSRGHTYFILGEVQKACADFSKACSLGYCELFDAAREKKMCR